jgi:hypothetical protein
MKIKECNDAKLGLLLKNFPLVSIQLGHSKIQGAVQEYLDQCEDTVELEFVRDLFTLTVLEIIDKWYGGEEAAFDLIFTYGEE